uniref:Translocated promoter region, nuclear basket protein n=1 Tax=Poecilia latipinna TaxID=48699 RepID=A0A3B3VZB4_9TELE
MAVVLLQALERTELNKLPKGVQNKLEKFVADLQNANEALKTQHERFKADSEQRYFDFEKQLTESQEQILSATNDLQILKEENKKLSEFSCIYYVTSKSKTCLISPKFVTFVFLEDMKRLNEKLTDTNKLKMELQLKLDEIQSSTASVQHREKRMEQEKELLEKKVDWLTAELSTKTEELLDTNREKGKEILELQGSLQSSNEQVSRLESQLTSLKELGESQSKRAEDLNNKLKQAKDEQVAMEEKYRVELNAHVKLSSLYKGAATDMEAKNQELSRAVEELSKLVKETGEANKGLEKKVSDAEEQKVRVEAELREKIKKMEKELENATTKAAGKNCGSSLTEEQLDSMCPSAAAIAAIVKPGMKFFDLYNAYAECQTQLQLEKQETRRVSKVLDEIVQEVESKAPVLKRQREEYESMQRSMASLCNKLEQARTEIYRLQKEKDEAKQSYDAMEREKLKAERQLEDSSAQLCNLLVELEEARGNQVSKDDGSSSDISSTSEVNSSSQLSFRSVMELQRQNQSLLGRLRELEEEKSRERSREENSVVDKLQKEVEQLREQRNQQKQLADSNARQRDMFKALLSQSTGFSLPPQGDTRALMEISTILVLRPSAPATRSTPQRAAAAESSQTAHTKAALKQLNDSFTLYKKEKAENDRMLNETNDRLQKQLGELRSSHAKLTSQLDFSNKRYEILQETVSAYRREINALQKSNQTMAATAQRHEHNIHTMVLDLRKANEKLALEQVRVENLTKERDMLRQAECRLSKEKEAVLAEQRRLFETETRQRLNNKIEQLEAELASIKAKLEEEVAQRHALGRTMDAQLLEAKKQLETQNILLQKTKELLRGSEQQVTALKAQLASASSSEPSQSEQELSDLKAQLRSAEEQNAELAEQLKNANATVEQYRSVVLTLEDSLKKEKESRSPLEVRVKQSEDVQKQLEKKMLEVEKLKQQDESKPDLFVEVLELQRHLKASQTEQQDALERAAAAVTQEQKATQNSLLQTKLAGEAQAKYERELMLHAADVEALQQLKKTFQQEAARKREIEEELKKATSLLQVKTNVWSTMEKRLKEELSSMKSRFEELGKQNTLLHQEMDEMAARSRQQQQQQQQQLDLSFSEEGKTTEQILEILRFVRREKEIAVAQCEASEGEALRYKQQVEHKDRELKELQEALNAERERMQLTSKTLCEQQEQLKKMESISALQETNRMLKLDRDKLELELQQAQAKVTKLQSDIAPLHNSLSILSEKNGSLQADKRLLEDDLKRWKAKVQHLVSQQKEGDAEEKQKITAEKEAQQKRVAQLIEEAAKLRTELARSNASSNSAQAQLQGLKDSVVRLTSEKDSLKKDLETKNNEILEKNRTITQVKKIGRRYKTQYEELKAQNDKSLAQARQNQMQQMQEELQQAKEAVQQNAAKEKELQQNHGQEVSNLKTSLSRAENKVIKTIVVLMFESYLICSFLQLSESKNREDQLKLQMAEKEEKTKKAILGAKLKINQVNKQLSQENEELKQSKEELEVRMNALKSQYEGRLLRMDRELRELRETQQSDQPRSSDQRQISLKSPAQDRGSLSTSEPPTANIRPTPSTQSPSNKPSPSTGSKSTPRASIRPMVTPAPVPIPTPTATVMPTTQTESQEALISTGASVHSTSSSLMNPLASLTQPTSTQATAFVQPTQQQAANQDAGSGVEAECPSTSSSSSSCMPTTGDQQHRFQMQCTHVSATDFLCSSLSQEDDDDDEEDDDGAADSGMRGGEEHNEESQEAEDEREEAAPSGGSNAEENASGAPSSSQRPADPSQSGKPKARSTASCTPVTSPNRVAVSFRRRHQLGSRSRIFPVKFIEQVKLTEHVCVFLQPFFDDDDRMVPSTPTLVVPHRTDGFAEAIHSPQVAGLSTRFRFGPPEDLLQQASASHSDLGQLASQGGLGMYESPLFLAAHDEDGGGRSVPTTPLQVAAPVTVFTENMPSDSGDNLASQSVPMVTASTGMAANADDGDEVFMEQEGDGPDIDVSLDGQMVMESTGQQRDDASLPSTSQDPDTSSDSQPRSVTSQRQTGILSGRGRILSRTGKENRRLFNLLLHDCVIIKLQ